MYLFLHLCDSNLIVRRGKPEEVVASLIKQLGSVSTVAFHEEVVKRLFLLLEGVTVLSRFMVSLFLGFVLPGNFRRTECGEKSERCLRPDEGQRSHLLGVHAVPQR